MKDRTYYKHLLDRHFGCDHALSIIRNAHILLPLLYCCGCYTGCNSASPNTANHITDTSAADSHRRIVGCRPCGASLSAFTQRDLVDGDPRLGRFQRMQKDGIDCQDFRFTAPLHKLFSRQAISGAGCGRRSVSVLPVDRYSEESGFVASRSMVSLVSWIAVGWAATIEDSGGKQDTCDTSQPPSRLVVSL